MEKKLKTPAKMREAIDRYEQKQDRINFRMPKGTIDRIKETGAESANAYILEALSEKLLRDTGKGIEKKQEKEEQHPEGIMPEPTATDTDKYCPSN